MQYRPRLKIYKSGTGKNTFNPETFEGHSYGWWKYVAKVKGVVVFNDYNYSSTTNKHQCEMRSLLKQLGIKIGAVVYQSASLDHGISLDHDYKVLAVSEVRLKAAKRKEQIKDLQAAIKQAKERIAVLRKLGAKASRKIELFRMDAVAHEKYRLEKQREKARIAREKRAAVVNEFKGQYESTAAVDV